MRNVPRPAARYFASRTAVKPLRLTSPARQFFPHQHGIHGDHVGPTEECIPALLVQPQLCDAPPSVFDRFLGRQQALPGPPRPSHTNHPLFNRRFHHGHVLI